MIARRSTFRARNIFAPANLYSSRNSNEKSGPKAVHGRPPCTYCANRSAAMTTCPCPSSTPEKLRDDYSRYDQPNGLADRFYRRDTGVSSPAIIRLAAAPKKLYAYTISDICQYSGNPNAHKRPGYSSRGPVSTTVFIVGHKRSLPKVMTYSYSIYIYTFSRFFPTIITMYES